MRASTLATLTLILLVSSAAQATPYIALKGEYAFSGGSDASLSTNLLNATADADYDDGYGGSVALGGYIIDSIRGEVEGGYHRLNYDSVTLNGGTVVTSNDQTELYSAMGNLYMDFGNSTPYTPYIGAGAGMAWDKDSHENALAYQGMAGVAARIGNGTHLLLGYKYFRTGDFDESISDPILGSGTESFDAEAHIVEGGLKYHF